MNSPAPTEASQLTMLGPSAVVDALQADEANARRIVIGMIVDAVKRGEWSKERALNQAMGPICMLRPWFRGRVWWQLSSTVLALKTPVVGRGKHKKWPTALRAANHRMVRAARLRELPLTQHGANAFRWVSNEWRRWGFKLTQRQVFDLYYRENKVAPSAALEKTGKRTKELRLRRFTRNCVKPKKA